MPMRDCSSVDVFFSGEWYYSVSCVATYQMTWVSMKLCCVFNFNPLYRFPIYKAMDDLFDCDFFFGDTVFENIERFDASQLRGFKHFLQARKLFRGYVWHSGIKSIFSRRYSHYLLTGSSSYLVNWLIYIYAFFMGKKVFLWTHGINAPIESKKSRLHCRMFYLPPSGIFLYGQRAVPYMEAIGCKKEKLHVIHNSLDTSLQTSLYEGDLSSAVFTNHFGNSDPVVIYIGRLQKRKRVSELIYAVGGCIRDGFSVNLVVVGPVEDDYSLPTLAEGMNIGPNVWFYGRSYNEMETSKLLYNANVCVCPAAVGLTAIHSLSYGTPVVTNDDFNNQMPEFESIKVGVTGSFYKTGDIDDLSANIKNWCGVSKQERMIIREKARETILKEWSVDYQIDLLKRVLHD